jgi:hypothetical protein
MYNLPQGWYVDIKPERCSVDINMECLIEFRIRLSIKQYYVEPLEVPSLLHAFLYREACIQTEKMQEYHDSDCDCGDFDYERHVRQWMENPYDRYFVIDSKEIDKLKETLLELPKLAKVSNRSEKTDKIRSTGMSYPGMWMATFLDTLSSWND